jgi:uncharacterized membrane protein
MFFGSILALTLSAGWLYRGILFPSNSAERYPWGSDTLGHLRKVDYLEQQLAQGILYPDLLPDWYLGLQMMRYHPPLPYYLLAGLNVFVHDTVAAGNWLIALCAFVGGASWLLYRRWIGWGPALIGGILFMFLPDNIRVALAEGNLPRVLATALLPFTFYCALRLMEETGTRWHRLGLIGGFALIVLCHAMMVAIYAVCITLVVGISWLARAVSLRRAVGVVASIVVGMMLSGWWLLPSLTGGITQLDSSAMTEALAVFRLQDYFTPTLRQGSPEVIYIGAALLLFSALLLLARRWHNLHTLPLLLSGWFGVLITTTGFNAAFNSLPLHSLLWPLRFLGIASFLLLLALMGTLNAWQGNKMLLLAVLVIGLIGLDQAGSVYLIHLRSLRPDILPESQAMAQTPGWRQATLDESRLGSAPSYFFSVLGQREQVFGWAYQGARAARSVAAINESMGLGNIAYLLDRLNLMGVDDVVALHGLPMNTRVAGALQASGYQLAYTGEATDLYHRDGGPRAIVAAWHALGIGRGAQNLAYLFPAMIVGSSTQVDDYTLGELTHYDTLFLSGFGWHNRDTAETLIRQATEANVNVVVDLTGVPDDPLARIPRFLDVWGEEIVLPLEPIRVEGGENPATLQIFGEPNALWATQTPQGLDVVTLFTPYLGERATLLGYNDYGSGRVWFVGLNLPYHAVLSGDPAAITILADVLHLPAETATAYTTIPLQGYIAGQSGYRFGYHLDQPARLFVPVAHHEGMQLWIDDQPTEIISLESLVAFDAPAGEHQVTLALQPTRIYRLGWLVSSIGGLGMLMLFLLEKRLWPVKSS